MSAYSLVVFVHITVACLLLASMVAALATRAALRSAETAPEVLRWLAFMHATTRANPLLAVGVLATGMYLMATGGWSAGWAAGWVYAAGLAFVLNSALLAPRARAGAMALATAARALGDAQVTPELDARRWARGWDFAGSLLVANDVATLFLMTNKPGVAGSLAVLALANVVTLAVRAWVLRARRSNRAARPLALKTTPG